MRIVIAYTNPIDELSLRKPLPGRSDDILCYGRDYTDLRCDPCRNSYADIAAQFPPGWHPDVFLHWCLEYFPVAQGLENADCLTVGMVGDWNLGGQAFQLLGGVFDMLFADRRGCELLRQADFQNVHYVPLWAYNPALHRRVPGIVRDLDIVMVGNFNHDIQRERAPWLAKVARLSRKYRVCVTSGVYGEEYLRLMNRAKIIFNRSIRSEINMRVYEAAACGALMFYERENEEIGELFADGAECVLYGDDDLEDLLDHYLQNEQERERIIEAAYQKVQPHTYAHHLAQMLDIIEAEREIILKGEVRNRRPFLSLPHAEQSLRRAHQWLAVSDRRNMGAAETELARVANLEPTRADIANAQACLLAESAGAIEAPAEQQALLWSAVERATRARTLSPNYVAVWINRAHIHLALGDPVTAEAELGEAVALLEAENVTAAQLLGPYYPRKYRAFDVEVERVWSAHPPGSEDWTTEMRRVLLWYASEELSDIAFLRERFMEAAEFATKAVELLPEIGTTRYRLARALRAVGRTEEAVIEYRRALAGSPFCTEMWTELAELLRDTEQYDKCRTFLEELYALLDGCPFYEPLRAHIQALEASIKQARREARPSSGIRLLACPDWNDENEWQPILTRYVQAYMMQEPVTLLLRVDSECHPPVEKIVSAVERHLKEALHITADRIPDVLLLNYPLRADERWKLFRQADAFITVNESCDTHLADCAGIPVFHVNSIDRARALMSIKDAA